MVGLVVDYINRKNMATLGYNFRLEDLTQFEFEYLSLIAGEFNRLENEEIEKATRTRGKH